MPLSESLCIVEESQKKLEKCQGHIGNVVREKCKNVIEKNQGLKNLKIIRDILQGLNPTELLDVELTPLDIVNMNATGGLFGFTFCILKAGSHLHRVVCKPFSD
ncbi:hypothetical protein QTP88_021535 [Uroleucon formosanum]